MKKLSKPIKPMSSISLALILILLFSLATPALAANSISGHWAEEPVNEFEKLGIANVSADGKLDNEFHLNSFATREQLVFWLYQIVDKTIGITEKFSGNTAFTDVLPTDPTAKAIQWACSTGVVKGTSETTFDPRALVTRQESAAFLMRYADIALSLAQVNAPIMFKDQSLISDYAFPSVQKSQITGIINGYPDGTFGPLNKITWAELAAMIWRMIGHPVIVEQLPSTDQKYPTFPESKVWRDNEPAIVTLLDHATTKDGIVTHVEATTDEVCLYFGAKWPVMEYTVFIYSKDDGVRITSFDWWPNVGFRNRGTIKLSNPTIEILMKHIDIIQGDYDGFKDIAPWKFNPPGIKFPWELATSSSFDKIEKIPLLYAKGDFSIVFCSKLIYNTING